LEREDRCEKFKFCIVGYAVQQVAMCLLIYSRFISEVKCCQFIKIAYLQYLWNVGADKIDAYVDFSGKEFAP
jgi:hypothetical protein